MIINPEITADIESAVATMRQGGIILYPTDTVWGIGCDATCGEAVKKIFTLKKRADSKSMLSLVSSDSMMERYSGKSQVEMAKKAIKASEPRSTTVIVSDAHGLAEGMVASDGSAAFRITDETYSKALCELLGHPVVSTSANPAGHTSPSIFNEIEQQIIDGVDYVALYRRDDNNRLNPSRIVKIANDGKITVIRE